MRRKNNRVLSFSLYFSFHIKNLCTFIRTFEEIKRQSHPHRFKIYTNDMYIQTKFNHHCRMKLAISLFAISQCHAFAPSLTHPSSMVALNANLGADMSGNTWKPDAERGNTNQMGSTDTGDYFP
jgi:hypothetical protein